MSRVLKVLIWGPILLNVPATLAFHPQWLETVGRTTTRSRGGSVLQVADAAKGFGASKNNSKTSIQKPSKKQVLKNLEKTYGGTTPEEIARGTQRRIDSILRSQPPHIQLAIQIYKQLQQWNYHLQGMTVLQQTKIPMEEMEGAKRAQAELQRIFLDHDMTERDLHNLLQQATWDASADAKFARSIMGEMPADTQKRVQKGCDIVVQHALTVCKVGQKPKVLDVGCGFGVLVPFLKKAGLQEEQIHGIDLSPEMIRNAQQSYPRCHFEAGDFHSYNPAGTQFDALIFCSSLHDLPEMLDSTLPKARDLLREDGGTLVILHPQGASHVQNQVRTNPTMVPRGLPNAEELLSLQGFRLIQAPAAPKSREETRDGYLAVLERVPL